MPLSPRWRAVCPSALSWRTWDDEFVVFDQRTGDTHHLGGLGALLLLTLTETPVPLGISELTEALGEVTPFPNAVALVQEALRGLEGIGLAERDSS